MSRLESLKVLISQRLTAAVEELFGHLETTISEYEEEVKCRYHKLLDAASEAEGELQTAAVQQRLVIKEEDDFEGPHIKEEKHDFWSSQDLTSRLQGPHGEDTTAFPFSHIYVKNEENREAEPSSSSSPELMRAEANGEDCGGPDANRTCAQDISGLSGSDDTSLGCCQAKTEDCADDWKEIRKCQSSRLAAAVDEIFGLLETTISNYEEEIRRQRRLLQAERSEFLNNKAGSEKVLRLVPSLFRGVTSGHLRGLGPGAAFDKSCFSFQCLGQVKGNGGRKSGMAGPSA
ncbi:hypothetical protein Q5P01_010685 [Channa striata]|uniref:Uncharacterized protein n=1 Tax=Channa striata TaxID=64152 RepID=A0AA88MRT9_CHASR|nr:hypothetical protein Q5P01_010685 [Channa striata]